MITQDLLAPGSHHWRACACTATWRVLFLLGAPHHGHRGTKPAGVGLFAILSEPINGYGGNSVRARVLLDNPAPAGAGRL